MNRLDLHACFNLLLLNPDSTLEDFRANVAFLRAMRQPDELLPHGNLCRHAAGTEAAAGGPVAGGLLGLRYRIRDERAQEAFEMMYVGLAGRHFGDNCVHHLTMRVDFERQVLQPLLGLPRAVAPRAKDLCAG